MNSRYPETAEAWKGAIDRALRFEPTEGSEALGEGRFPFDRLAAWISGTFAHGYSADFVPALLRNLRGLVEWAYGGGSEPHWPGEDDATEG